MGDYPECLLRPVCFQELLRTSAQDETMISPPKDVHLKSFLLECLKFHESSALFDSRSALAMDGDIAPTVAE